MGRKACSRSLLWPVSAVRVKYCWGAESWPSLQAENMEKVKGQTQNEGQESNQGYRRCPATKPPLHLPAFSNHARGCAKLGQVLGLTSDEGVSRRTHMEWTLKKRVRPLPGAYPHGRNRANFPHQRPRLIGQGLGMSKVISSRPSSAIFFRKLVISPIFACSSCSVQKLWMPNEAPRRKITSRAAPIVG